MKWTDFETLYALGLDDVITGERAATEEEEVLLSAIAAGAPGFNGKPHSFWARGLSLFHSLFGAKNTFRVIETSLPLKPTESVSEIQINGLDEDEVVDHFEIIGRTFNEAQIRIFIRKH